MAHRFLLVDVFTEHAYSGNQLAVFCDADEIDPAYMQRFARELNFSETVFVLAPEDPENTVRLRIFTPEAEVPFAGHPVIGTAFALDQHREDVQGDEDLRFEVEAEPAASYLHERDCPGREGRGGAGHRGLRHPHYGASL
jgi:PhzF family phenazine biosynthesis protein